MEPVEFTAKTTEECLRAAQEHFGLSLDQLEVEVVNAGSGGLFGFLGSKKAVVRAKPRGKSQVDEVAELVAEMTESSNTSLGLGKKEPPAKPQPKPEPPQAKPRGETPRPTAKPPVAKPQPKPQPRPPAPKAPVRAEVKPPASQPPADSPAPGEPRLAPPAPPAQDKATPPPAPPREAPAPAAPPAAEMPAPSAPPRRARNDRPEDGPEVLAYASEVLNRLAQSLDSRATVEPSRGEHGVELNIVGGEPGVLIGRRGQTLDALQYLATRIVSHKFGRAVHLSVDSGGYRTRRRASLEDLARRAAEKARATRKAQSMGPLSAQERRVVHLVLRSQKGISTVSRGKGELKKVVITPR